MHKSGKEDVTDGQIGKKYVHCRLKASQLRDHCNDGDVQEHRHATDDQNNPHQQLGELANILSPRHRFWNEYTMYIKVLIS